VQPAEKQKWVEQHWSLVSIAGNPIMRASGTMDEQSMALDQQCSSYF
jgi:hypothetical protein